MVILLVEINIRFLLIALNAVLISSHWSEHNLDCLSFRFSYLAPKKLMTLNRAKAKIAAATEEAGPRMRKHLRLGFTFSGGNYIVTLFDFCPANDHDETPADAREIATICSAGNAGGPAHRLLRELIRLAAISELDLDESP